MASKLAKKRVVPTKDDLAKDLFEDATSASIPEPVDPVEDEVETEDGDIVGENEAEIESMRDAVKKEFGDEGLKEFDNKLKEMDEEETGFIGGNDGKVSGEGSTIGGIENAPLIAKPEALKELNRSASFILNCLPPGTKKDFEVAAYDNRIEDIGVYLLGLLNQAYKMGDYYNPDVEKEWEAKSIGYSGNLVCQYCQHPIVNPKNINQVFCSNVCARNSQRYSTGIIQPSEKHRPTEEAEDKRSYENEVAG